LRKAAADPLASEQLARLIVSLTPINTIPFDYVIPVPLHWTRYAHRGYNQAAVMAKVVARACDVPVLNALKRIKRTPFQSTLNVKARQENVRNVFALRRFFSRNVKETLQGKRILLVDDLCTTAATITSAARALLPARPAEISAVVACRVL